MFIICAACIHVFEVHLWGNFSLPSSSWHVHAWRFVLISFCVWQEEDWTYDFYKLSKSFYHTLNLLCFYVLSCRHVTKRRERVRKDITRIRLTYLETEFFFPFPGYWFLSILEAYLYSPRSITWELSQSYKIDEAVGVTCSGGPNLLEFYFASHFHLVFT